MGVDKGEEGVRREGMVRGARDGRDKVTGKCNNNR